MTVQTIFYADDKVDKNFDAFYSKRKGKPVFDELSKNRIKFLEKGTISPLFSETPFYS